MSSDRGDIGCSGRGGGSRGKDRDGRTSNVVRRTGLGWVEEDSDQGHRCDPRGVRRTTTNQD